MNICVAALMVVAMEYGMVDTMMPVIESFGTGQEISEVTDNLTQEMVDDLSYERFLQFDKIAGECIEDGVK